MVVIAAAIIILPSSTVAVSAFASSSKYEFRHDVKQYPTGDKAAQ
jgi:hypothetical protein